MGQRNQRLLDMKDVIIIAICFILFVVVAKQARKVDSSPVSEQLFTDKEIEEWKPFD
jgi:hypothetical protein